MADADPRKPDPIDPPEDDGLYELAEDPDVSEPSPAAPPPPGIGRPSPLDNDRLDPMLDDTASPPEPKPDRDMKTGSGGKGAASHFSGDDPEYVNPEIARMRREEARIKAAEEEAEADAKKKKMILVIAVVSALVGVVAYALLF